MACSNEKNVDKTYNGKSRKHQQLLFQFTEGRPDFRIEIVPIDLIHDSRHVGFAIIKQISYTLLRGQTTQVREVITNFLATQMICFMFIECLSPK